MLGKIKFLFKVFIASIVIVLILFGIYRREYISQAIPVYMQYLEQKEKWEEISTGTYVYYNPPLRTYFFIKNNTLVKLMQYGLPWEPEHVENLENSYLFNKAKERREIRCFFEKKEYLIEKKFDAVKRLILIEKLLDKYAPLTECYFSLSLLEIMNYMGKIFMQENRYDKYAYEIAYNNHNGHPILVGKKRMDHKDNIVLGVPSPFRILYIKDLLMFPEETEYTYKVLKKVLDYYGSRDRHKRNQNSLTVPVLNIVGGNLIKSAILDTNETFEF